MLNLCKSLEPALGELNTHPCPTDMEVWGVYRYVKSSMLRIATDHLEHSSRPL